MPGYSKLFSSIVTSTVWGYSPEICKVWVTMLALADKHGVVEASVPGLAHAARVSLETAEEALDTFLSPDEYSRSQEHEGRRIEPVDGGWRLLNHAKYRKKLDLDDRRRKNAEYQRAYRARQRAAVEDPTTHAEEARELEQTRRAKPPEAPPFKPEAPCCDCDSGPMVLRRSKYEDGSGWYYHCNVCGVNCDAGAYGDRWKHNKGATGAGGAEWCPRCGKMRLPDGDTLCVYCQQDAGVV